MINKLFNARQKAKNAIESLFEDTCNIYTYEQIKDAKTGITSQEKVIYLEDIPCRISYSNFPSATDDEVAKVTQGVKLFLSSDIKIKEGSYISITRQNTTTDYACSGKVAIYFTHQEINLKLAGEYT